MKLNLNDLWDLEKGGPSPLFGLVYPVIRNKKCGCGYYLRLNAIDRFEWKKNCPCTLPEELETLLRLLLL